MFWRKLWHKTLNVAKEETIFLINHTFLINRNTTVKSLCSLTWFISLGRCVTSYTTFFCEDKRNLEDGVFYVRGTSERNRVKDGLFRFLGWICGSSWTVVCGWTKKGWLCVVYIQAYYTIHDFTFCNTCLIHFADVLYYLDLKAMFLICLFQFRFVVKYRHCDGKLVLKGTDDQVVII